MQEQILAELTEAIDEVSAIRRPTGSLKDEALYDRLVELVIAADDICRGSVELEQSTIDLIGSKINRLKRAIARTWAGQVESADESLIELRRYPYLDDCWLLVNRELTLVRLTGPKLDNQSRLLVVGEEVLPLTTCHLLQHTGAVVDCLSRNAADSQLASGVARVLGLAPHCNFIDQSIESAKLDQQYDLMIVNPPANDDKVAMSDIISRLLPMLKLSGRLIVRSASGYRQLLRPPLLATELAGCQLLLSYRPVDNVIESSLIYRRQK